MIGPDPSKFKGMSPRYGLKFSFYVVANDNYLPSSCFITGDFKGSLNEISSTYLNLNKLGEPFSDSPLTMLGNGTPNVKL